MADPKFKYSFFLFKKSGGLLRAMYSTKHFVSISVLPNLRMITLRQAFQFLEPSIK